MKTYKHLDKALERVNELKKLGCTIIKDGLQFEHESSGRFVLIHVLEKECPYPLAVIELDSVFIDKKEVYMLAYLYKN